MLGGFLALLALTGMARAQVFSIADDGSVARYAGPVVTTAEGVRPLSGQTAPSAAPAAGTLRAVIGDAAARQHLSPRLVEAVAWQESRFHQDAVSPKGARGVMQLMPDTARALGVDAGDLGGNVHGGAAYLARMLDRFDGDLIEALAAYDAGPEAVARYGGVPPYAETRAYVDAVLDRLSDGQPSETRQ